MQAAMRRDDLQPGSQPKVESIAEHDLRADGMQIRGAHGFHRTISPHRHEDGRFDAAMRECQAAAPGQPIP